MRVTVSCLLFLRVNEWRGRVASVLRSAFLARRTETGVYIFIVV